jgi:hypothetical protein
MPAELSRLLRSYLVARPARAELSQRDAWAILDQVRWLQRLMEPGLEKSVHYLLFDCMRDPQDGENHRALDGGIAPLEWSGWNRFAPPLGPGCRCTLVGISAGRMRRLLGDGLPHFDLRIASLPNAGPDAGWDRRDGWWEEFLNLCGTDDWEPFAKP